MASTNLPSKLARALCHYLVKQGVAPYERAHRQGSTDTIDLSAGPAFLVRVGRGVSDPAAVPTGCWRFPCYIRVLGSAAQHPDDPNTETARVAFDAAVGKLYDALCVSDDGGASIDVTVRAINTAAYTLPVAADATAAAVQFAENNADMADFTLLDLTISSYGECDVEGCTWSIQLDFSAQACEKAIPLTT